LFTFYTVSEKANNSLFVSILFIKFSLYSNEPSRKKLSGELFCFYIIDLKGWSVNIIIRWSVIFIPRGQAVVARVVVIFLSAGDGFRVPLGWLWIRIRRAAFSSMM
jgi:hypothetical protein